MRPASTHDDGKAPLSLFAERPHQRMRVPYSAWAQSHTSTHSNALSDAQRFSGQGSTWCSTEQEESNFSYDFKVSRLQGILCMPHELLDIIIEGMAIFVVSLIEVIYVALKSDVFSTLPGNYPVKRTCRHTSRHCAETVPF